MLRSGRDVRTSAAPRRPEPVEAAFCRGERWAFDELYARYGGTTFAMLVSHLRERPAAEDVHQQAWLDAWRTARSYRPERAPFLAWVLLISRSRLVDHVRRRPKAAADVESHLEELAGPDAADELVERWTLAHALTRIPAQEAELLRLRFHAGLSQAEIAEQLDVPLGTVKSRMVSGLSGLRRLLETEGAG
jgi:RNA polymerase sigma-70 factor (ECF subfamily)